MDKTIELLKKIHFSEHEARIYLHLLKYPGQTVFQISKDLHIARSSIYTIIQSMYERGILILEQGAKELYFSEKPESLLDVLNKDYQKNLNLLKKSLEHIEQPMDREPYLNLVGFYTILGKVRTLLYGAEKEVYMNTDMNLFDFDDAFSHLERKGVDVYIFSFAGSDYKRTNVHHYNQNLKREDATRLMLVVDLETVLVANYHKERNEWTATLTKNDLMVSIITEHIHHDIYLNKLYQKEGSSLFKTHPDLPIGTYFERVNTLKTKKHI